MLALLKTLHTIVWAIMTAANFVAFFLALAGKFDVWFFIAVTLLGGEILVIVINSWHCPLTAIMARYTSERRANFDIYLPEWLARNNIRIFATLIVLEIIIVVFKGLRA